MARKPWADRKWLGRVDGELLRERLSCPQAPYPDQDYDLPPPITLERPQRSKATGNNACDVLVRPSNSGPYS